MKIFSARPSSGDDLHVAGFAAPEFREVREEFARNFSARGERGAACAIYLHGTKVVDLWGGYRCARARKPWAADTCALVFSVSKGMAAAAMAVAHAQGLFELDEAVAAYWPEFSASGKRDITVRQLLAHQAGLVALDSRLDAMLLANHDRLAEILARQVPAWRPGNRHGYHTLTLGWYQNELLRRIDPRRRSLGKFFQDEIAQRLGVEFYIGLPASVPEEQLAVIQGFNRLAMLGHLNKLPPRMVLAGIWPKSLVARSVSCLQISNPARIAEPRFRQVEIPSANGIGQARALARIYDVLAGGGHELGLSARTMGELVAPAPLPTMGTYDAILKIETLYHLGFSRPSRDMSFGSSGRAFGCPGAGGSFAMADPDERLGFAYVTNQMGFHLFDDPREKAVRDACYRCLAAIRHRRRVA